MQLSSASIWVVGGYIASFGLKFFFSLLLTRFLDPAAFGVAMLATSVSSTITLAMDLGLLQYLLRISEDEFDSQRRAVWTYQVLHGLALCLVITVAAVAILILQHSRVLPDASAMASANFPYVIFVLALIPLIQGFRSTQLCFHMRNLNRKPLVLLDLTAHLISIGVVLLYLQWVAHDVWALPVGWLAYMLSNTCLSFARYFGSFSHRFTHDASALLALKKFAPWIWASSVVHVFVSQADKLLLGVVATSVWMGIYSVSLTILSAASGVLIALITSIGLPKLSKSFHEGPTAFAKNYARYAQLTDYAIIACSVGMIVLGGALVRLLFPERFHSAGDLLALIAPQVYFARSQFTTQVLLAMNQPKLQFRLSLIQAVALVCMLPLGYFLGGVQGCVLAISIAMVLVAAFCINLERRYGLEIATARSIALILLPLSYILTRFVLAK
jgi:O-antigen/teichoic acid export membrane protein